MNDVTSAARSATFSTLIAIGKDLVSLLRDAALFLLALLLVAFPAQFNSILVRAGFEEGSVVGFKWKSSLVVSDQALQDANKTIAQIQAKNDELLKALADANMKVNDPQQLAHLAKLEEENRRLKEQTQKVQSVVSDTIESNAPLVAKALSSTEKMAPATRDKSAYSVGLQTVGVDDNERVSINEKLRDEGYGLDPTTWSYPADQRPPWFAAQSTVFYYSGSSRPMAEQLARSLKRTTGQDFIVQRGAGLGVDPSRADLTLFVHYIKP